MTLPASRLEVMHFVGDRLDSILSDFLKPIETYWQPADLLPDATRETFFEEVRSLQESCRELPYDYMAVLIGDTITEEALPTYESWLMDVIGIEQHGAVQPWAKWVRGWTAEENRHGDLLNKYLYLSGRVNMHQMEVSTQYLITDGFDIGTGRDPYRNFIYTSFQELATNVSHRRTATLAKQFGNAHLSKILAVDVSEMLLAFEDMMRKKIVMPAHFLRESGVQIGQTFSHFSDAAQRLGVYTTNDYIDILDSLLVEWNIGDLTDLTDTASRARDYLMALPTRLRRVADRTKVPELAYEFSWIS
jgi:acyl-[acyl-carrier-protein] desaturase